MNACSLSLLRDYDSSGDSDDVDVPGPRVSTKRTLHDDSPDTKKLCVDRLPVPSALTSMYVEDKYDVPRTDDPMEHEGRTRSFAHERGNWPSSVFINFPIQVEHWEKLSAYLTNLEGFSLKMIQDPHLSLSRTVILRHHWIDSFISELRRMFRTVSSFEIHLSGLEIYVNDEETRTFLALKARSSLQDLLTLSKLTDAALAEFNLPSFYQEASFHVSIAWCLGNQQELLTSALKEIEKDLIGQNLPEIWPVKVSYVTCRTGNKNYEISLKYK